MSRSLPFDPLAALPTGTTLLEASAGTGKTYTIAALATRYIAEGITTIDEMLIITFGRSATRELRERVRESLTRARDALRSGTPQTDVVIQQLLSLPQQERQAAADRLARAVADFDAGTIATTHQFCMHALAGLGIIADTDPGEVFVESITDLIDEVVDDFYVRKYGGPPAGEARIPYDEAKRLARAAVGDPQAALDAGPVEATTIQATRLAFAQAVRNEVLRRRRARRLVTFDDLVLRLQDALADDNARQRLRENYQVVLVDEFQDTDPAQWSILRHAFHGHRTLILIGDPKQAIYAFRGADVFSYLDAAGHADHHATLPTNWRSDAAVVKGVEAMLGGLELGDTRITVHPVGSSHPHPRIVGIPGDARVRLRTLCPEEPPGVGVQRKAVAADVAADIVDLLSGPVRLNTEAGIRPVAAGDIAVLVGTHRQAASVHDALTAAGVPVVVNSASSVFATPAAAQWATLLAAMLRPRGAALRDVALTDFLGHTPQELASAGELTDAVVAWQVRGWAQVLREGSVAQLVVAMEQDGLAARVLSRTGGERDLTDLRHVAGALHAHHRRTRTGLVGLADWLTDQIRRASEVEREPTSELTRRLETDAQAVQVLTVHTSKGLEFPVAYVPFAWDRGKPGDQGPIRCHDSAGRRVLDVRGEGAVGRDALIAARDTEEAAESLRQLYVALTRASSLLVVHWASSKQNTRFSPLHRALSAQVSGDTVPAPGYSVADPPAIASPWVLLEPVTAVTPRRWKPTVPVLPELAAAPFTRILDTTWRRTSYSGLTRTVHEAERTPSGFRDDEPDEVLDEPVAADPATDLRSPFADLPAGAAFGTLVHAVLEAVDTGAPDLPAEIAARCQEQLIWHPVPGATLDVLASAVLAAMVTPLGPLADNRTLGAIAPADRLPELDFEYPMGGNAMPTLGGLAALLRRHLPADDPLAPYADRLEHDGLGTSTLVGYLSGSIDAVLRVSGRRFLVVDYKTNLLREPTSPGVEGLVSGYRPPRLATAMMEAHYPLQALLYSAALHRYLRWRLPDYDPTTDFGGVLYLFVRGMAGPETPDGCGVFSWRPPAGLVVELSELLDGGSR